MENLQPTPELHVCMGLNSCQNQGYSGKNDCAGMGDCATISHPCHTLNECKGQGGCGLFGTTEEFCFPSQNDCRYQGSCGAPILDSRFVTQGPNRGNSVWQLARQRFEQARAAVRQPVGPPPAGPYGPSNDYVNQLKHLNPPQNNESCGQSGSRECSYAADPNVRAAAARERVRLMAEASARNMPATLATCPRLED
jgi:hypothetical protein